MGSVIAVTKQYGDVASGVQGGVGKLSSGLVSLTEKMTGFNKINSVALDQAASYQKAMSGVAARGNAASDSIARLEKSTMRLARSFPVGMGEAVQVMGALQEQGFKSGKQMDSLAKSFVQLGAATGTNAAGIGQQFLQLSRSFGNGAASFSAFSDSLTTTVAKMGGSAPSVVAFSKALAPIASTVGLSETAVIGLSTAMSKLGEDGGYAATSFNKVLLDLTKATRYGGPELKAYADLMGMTSDQLSKLMKQSPAEVVNRFSEAIAKAGPDIQRNLDALGFDSVRTTKSVLALAQSGGTRQAIDIATKAYGDGSTARAAGEAMGGVNDQAQMLKETMSQTVAEIGKPLLGIATTQLKIANSVAGMINSVVGSGPGQAITGAGGVLAGVGSFGMTALSLASTVGAVRWGIGTVRKSRFGQGFGAGRMNAAQGMAPELAYGAAAPGMMGAGEKAGYFATSMMMAPGMGSLANDMEGNVVRRSGAAMMMNGAARLNNSLNTNWLRSIMGKPPLDPSAEYERMKTTSALYGKSLTGVGALEAGAEGPRMPTGRDVGYAVNDYRNSFAAETRGQALARLGRSAGGTVLASGEMLAGSAAKTIGTTAAMVAPIVASPLAIAGGLGGLGYMMYSEKQTQDTHLQNYADASKDIYSATNAFAAAAGEAGRGLVSFTAALETATAGMAKSVTTFSKSTEKLSADEMSQANKPGYTPAFKLEGDNITGMTGKEVAGQIISQLGPGATPSDIERAKLDVYSQTKNSAVTNEAMSIVGKMFQDGKTPNVDYDSIAAAITGQGGWFGTLMGSGTDAQNVLGTRFMQVGDQAAVETGRAYGGKVNGVDATTAASLGEANKMIKTLVGTQDETTRKALVPAIANKLGVTDKDAISWGFAGSDINNMDGAFNAKLANSKNPVQDFLTQLQSGVTKQGGGTIQTSKDLAALMQGGIDINNIDLKRFASTPATETEFRKNDSLFAKAMGASNGLADALYGADAAARKVGKTFATLPTDVRNGLTDTQRALGEYSASPADADKAYKAGQALLNEALKANNGNQTAANAQLRQAAAGVEAGPLADALSKALELQGPRQQLAAAARSAGASNVDAIRAGLQAQRGPMPTDSAGMQEYQTTINTGLSAQTSAIAQMRGTLLSQKQVDLGNMQAQRGAGIQIGAMTRDERINEQHAQIQFDTQQKRQRADYLQQVRWMEKDDEVQRMRAKRDFDRSQTYAETDYQTARSHMQRDYDTQMLRAQRDFDKSQDRARSDYDKSVLRADEDQKLTIARANRDFSRSQERAEADYNKSRIRSVEDYNKQLKRLIEDSAKSMYDPYKRMNVQMIVDAGQLVQNLKDQTDAINKQVQNLADARSMGLSDAAIQQLNLADAGNAQQLSRIVSDMKGNQSYADQLNQAAAAKQSAAGALVSDKGNVSTARMAEDFATSMTRGEQDFQTSVDRSKQDFATSMSDQAADFAKAMARGADDFAVQMARSSEDYKTGIRDAGDNLKVAFDDAALQHKNDVDRALTAYNTAMDPVNGDLAVNLKTQLDHMATLQEQASERGKHDLKQSIEWMRLAVKNAISDIGANLANARQSAQEQLTALNQSTVEGEKAVADEYVKWVETQSKKFKIPIADMGEQIRANYEAAKLILNGLAPLTAVVPNSGFDYAKKSGMASENAQAMPAPAPIPAPKLAKIDWQAWAADSAKDAAPAGAAVSDALTRAMGNSLTGGPAMKTLTGAGHQAGQFVAAGVNKSAPDIDASSKDAFDRIVSNMPKDTAVQKSVAESLGLTKSYLQGLSKSDGESVSKWTGTAWWSMVSNVPSADAVKSKVAPAFGDSASGAKGFLLGLSDPKSMDSVSNWVGGAWNHLADDVPNPTGKGSVHEAVVPAFGDEKSGIKGYLLGLSSTKDGGNSVKGWVGDAWHHTTDDVPSEQEVKGGLKPLALGQVAVLEGLFDIWRQFHIDIPIPDWARGKFGIPDQNAFTLGFPGPPSAPTLKGNWEKPVKHAALGGIMTGPEHVFLGEAGYPEAVIPLNQRGAEVLAATMARYVGQSEVRGAMVSGYSTPVVNNYSSHSYDHSTQFNGQITVQANDPNAMALALQAQARRRNLVQPIRGRSS